MKKFTALYLILAVLLCGCGPTEAEQAQLFLGDTVVNIPLNPEESQTEEATQLEETTEEQTEAAEDAEETRASTTQASSKASTSKSSSSKASGSKTSSSSKKNTSSSNKTSKEPAETKPVQTEPPVTEPEPTETIPEETVPPETESPEADIYDISDYSVGSLEYAVVEQINACREEAGLAALSMNGRLCGIASVRAYEVCVSWSHIRPNGGGWQSVLGDYGFGCSVAAEELAHTSGYDAASIVSKWMGSESAGADLLSESFTTIGVGVYSEGGAVYIAAILIG